MPKPIVADLSHYSWSRGVPDFAKAQASGTMGVIYKASEGLGWTDPTYTQSRTLAQKAGLLWGAYHFGTNADGKAQADAFLKAADPAENTMIALDFEKNATPMTLSISNTEPGQPCVMITGSASGCFERT